MQRAPSRTELRNTDAVKVNTPTLRLRPHRDVTDGRERKLCTQAGLRRTGRSTLGRGKEQEEDSKPDLPWLLSRSCSPFSLPNSFKRVKNRPWCRWSPMESGTVWFHTQPCQPRAPVRTTAEGPHPGVLWGPQATGHSAPHLPLPLSVQGEHVGLPPPPIPRTKI